MKIVITSALRAMVSFFRVLRKHPLTSVRVAVGPVPLHDHYSPIVHFIPAHSVQHEAVILNRAVFQRFATTNIQWRSVDKLRRQEFESFWIFSVGEPIAFQRTRN